MECSEIIRRFNMHVSERSTIESTWEMIEQFVVPFRGRFFQDNKTEGSIEWKTRNVYDSTAIMANQTLASSIHGSLTSPAIRWFQLRFRNEKLNTDGEAKKWLEEVSDRMYYALQDSNFNLEAAETYTDLTSFGSSVIVEEYEESSDNAVELVFSSIPIKECYFDECHRGMLLNFYRKLSWTPMQIVSKFGEDKVPAHIRELAEAGKMEKHDLVFCVYKRKKGEYSEEAKGPVAEESRKYGYKYVLLKTGDKLKEGGYYEMPAFVPRWRKTSDSKWGNSPAMIALPDIMTLNQLVELIIRSSEKVVDPATLVTERGLISDLDLTPGGMTVVRDIEGSIKPYESRARFDVSELQREKLKDSVNRAFYVDQLQLKDSPAMTATEVQVRYELMQRLLGPTLGRLMSDFLDPLLSRTFNIMYRNGALPERPEVLNNESDLDIQYVGPLARAQKSDVAASTERWLGMVAQMAEIKPEVLEFPDWELIVRDHANVLNVPAKYMKSASKIAADRKKQQQAQSQMMALEQAKMAGEAGESLGKAAQSLKG